jgi:hypothetical protein
MGLMKAIKKSMIHCFLAQTQNWDLHNEKIIYLSFNVCMLHLCGGVCAGLVFHYL